MMDERGPGRRVSVGALQVEQDCSAAWLSGSPLPLSYAQRRLLLILMLSGGRVVGRETLYEAAFGRELPERSRAVDTLITRIRRALGDAAAAIVCVGRVGYRLDGQLLHSIVAGRRTVAT